MEDLVYLLPVLGCAAMLGLMVWIMRRNHQPAQPERAARADPGTQEEIALLRAELETLKAQQAESSRRAAGEPPRR